MPARTRQRPSASAAATTTTTTATEVVDQPEEDHPEEETPEQGKPPGLKFNEPITWRVGRAAIPIADLLQRLQTLAQELRKLEQEDVDTNSLTKVSQELATSQILAHKDKGVRAWAVCCIVDVLRLCAPYAPFTGNQLKVWQVYSIDYPCYNCRFRRLVSFCDWAGADFTVCARHIGYFYVHCVLDHSLPGRPIAYLQCPAYLRLELSRRSEECGAYDRSRPSGFLDRAPFHRLF